MFWAQLLLVQFINKTLCQVAQYGKCFINDVEHFFVSPEMLLS